MVTTNKELTLPDHGIRAVLFDLDGVLIDAAGWHKEAFDRALTAFGLEPLDEEDHLINFNGLSTYRKLEILVSRGHDEFENEIMKYCFYDNKQAFTETIIKEKCSPVTRVIDTVNYANSIFDGQTAVVTNCSRRTAELMLVRAKLIDKFRVIITNEDVDGKIKPHPRPYLKAQAKLGLTNRKAALAVDDTNKGIMSALDADCRTWHLKRFEDLSVRNLMRVLKNYRITI